MLPVLVHFTFTSLWSQLLLYGLALAVVAYIAYNGWQGADDGSDQEIDADIDHLRRSADKIEAINEYESSDGDEYQQTIQREAVAHEVADPTRP